MQRSLIAIIAALASTGALASNETPQAALDTCIAAWGSTSPFKKGKAELDRYRRTLRAAKTAKRKGK